MMLPGIASIAKLLVCNCCLSLLLILICQPDSFICAEARRHGYSRSPRPKRTHGGRYRLSTLRQSLRQPGHPNFVNTRKGSYHSQRVRPTVDARTERIKQAILTLPELSKLLDPLRHASNLDDFIKPVDNLRLSGTVRQRRLYCRAGMGYHLEIRQDGRVVGRHRPTDDGILEIFSVKAGVVGVRGVRSHRYLCMDNRGKLYSTRTFNHECQFRERIEENHFNTYASNAYSNHKTQSGYYMSLTKRGKSKKSKNVTGRQRKAHWLPRSVND